MIRIGLAQIDVVWENIEENKKTVENYLKRAVSEKVDWLVFPEMTMTGFSMNTSMAVYYEEQKEYFRKKAQEYHVGIIYGVIAPGQEEKFENHMVFVDENGKECMEYAKIHPFTYGAEGKYYTGGEQVYACRWHDVGLSGFVCYDIRFPQIFQIASMECQVIFVIANWPVARVEQWDALLKARAIENSCYVVGVNRVGKAGRLLYTGHSAVYDYRGNRLTEILEEESLIIADVDETKVPEFREEFPAIKDRRPDLYKKMILQMTPSE